MSKTVCRMALAFMIAASLATAAVHADTRNFWTTIGATGDVDEADVSKVLKHDTGSIALKSSVVGRAVVRYNVVAVGGLENDDDPAEPEPSYSMGLNALVRDTGPTARVIVRLRQMNRETGALTTLATLDSDGWDSFADDQYHRRGVIIRRSPGDLVLGLDFVENAYFVEVELIKTAASGNPGLKAIAIVKDGS
jgi:hypothetical protein